jgi:hypothetical protein
MTKLEKREIKVMQALINSGQAWKMEGSVGRQAMHMIEAGLCVLGTKSHRDYYGNKVPSRYEVKPGTKGSLAYRKAAMAADKNLERYMRS